MFAGGAFGLAAGGGGQTGDVRAALGHLQRAVFLGQEGQGSGDLVDAGVALFFEVADHVHEEAEFLGGDHILHLLAEGIHPLVGDSLAAGQAQGFDGLAGGPLDLAQQVVLTRGDKQDRVAGAACRGRYGRCGARRLRCRRGCRS